MQSDALITYGARTTKEFRRNLDNIAEDHWGGMLLRKRRDE